MRSHGIATSALLVPLLLLSLAVGAAAAATEAKGPWLLTSLPSMGSISWRCDPARERAGRPALALTLNTRTAAATQSFELRAGRRRVVRGTLQPGQVAVLPYLRSPVQKLTVVQSTEPGTLRAVVTVDFRPRAVSPSHCWEHLPPGLRITVTPR